MVTKGLPVIAATFAQNSAAKPGAALMRGSHRGAALGQFVQRRQRRLDAGDGSAHLRGVAAELLAQRERRGVLQMRAPDFDQRGVGVSLAGQSGFQSAQSG